jgi:hypothetical protein
MMATKTPKLMPSLLISLLTLVLGSASGYFSAYHLLKEPTRRLNQLSPIVVLDRSQFIQNLSPTASPEQMARAVESWQRLAKQLSSAGYVVLDTSAVIAAPDDVTVKPEGR